MQSPMYGRIHLGYFPRMDHLRHKTAGGFASWVAILAIALNALWPLLAQLQPGDEASMQMEACAEMGMHHDDAGEHDSAPAQPSPLMPHCAFCSLAAGGFAALVAQRVDVAPLIIALKEVRPALPDVQLPTFFGYSPAHPRAPPVLS